MRRPRGRGRSDEAGGRAGPDHNRDINPRKHGRTDANPAVRLTSAERPDSALPLQLESKCMPSPGRQISGMAGARNPVDLPKGYHTPARGQSCTRSGRRFRRGLPRAGARSGCALSTGCRTSPVRFGGANSERTTCQRSSGPATDEHEHEARAALDGTTCQQSGACVRVHTEEVTGSIPVSPTSTGRRPGGIGYARFKERQNGRKQAR